MELAFLSADRGACTADLAPTTTEIEVPRGISADEPLTVVLHHGSGEEQFVVPASGNWPTGGHDPTRAGQARLGLVVTGG